MSENVLLVGATSGIAQALAAELARRGHNLMLAGRDTDELERTAADLRLRFGAPADVFEFDALAFDDHAALIERAARRLPGGLDGVVCCQGWMADEGGAGADLTATRRMMELNYTSIVSVLGTAARYFEQAEPPSGGSRAKARRRYLCAISSVAGDRGRQSNFAYGASKSALDAWLSGLRNHLAPRGVAVITIKPGCVDTGMTYGMQGLPLLATPERVAVDIARAIERRASVAYTPRVWRPIMAAVRAIPEGVFQRLRL